jgi:GGDEF domain-containing protein
MPTVDFETEMNYLESWNSSEFLVILNKYNPEKDLQFFDRIIRSAVETRKFVPLRSHFLDREGTRLNFVLMKYDCIKWAHSHGFILPDKFALPKQPLNSDMTATERSTILKILIGMAADKYEYNHKASKNTATGTNKTSIRAGLQRVGLDADESTIKKYLDEASELHGDEIKITSNKPN